MDWLRHAARRVLRNHVKRAYLPRRYGRRPIYLSAANQLGVLKLGDAKFVSSLFDFVDRFAAPDSVVWDVGVNMGTFAIPAATRARFVLGFEPDTFNQRLLQRSKAANPDLKIEILPVAVSDTVGTARLGIAAKGRASNSIDAAAFSGNRGEMIDSFSVITITLDWALDHFPAPDLVKCDAEGVEDKILSGSARLLSDIRPVIIIEIAGTTAAACLSILAANDYHCFSAYAPVQPNERLSDLGGAWDVVAIPAEKVAAFTGV